MSLQVKSILGVGIVRLFGTISGALITIVLSRLIGPAGVGVYAYIVALLAILAIPVSKGWATLMLRKAAMEFTDQEWCKTRGMASSSNMISVIVAVISCLIIFSYLLIAPSKYSPATVVIMILMFGVALVFDQLSACRVALIRGMQSPTIAQLSDLVIKPVVLISTVFIIYYLTDVNLTFQSIMFAIMFASALNFFSGQFALIIVSPLSYKASTKAPLEYAWLKQALLLAANSGMVVVAAYVDILILGFFVPTTSVGVYKVAAQVALLSGIGYAVMNFVVSPLFASAKHSGDFRQMQKWAVTGSRLSLLATAAAFIFVLMFGKLFLKIVFGEAFEQAYLPMLILCGLQIVSASVGMANMALLMNGFEHKIARLSLVMLCLNIVLCFILSMNFGIVGAAISTFTAGALWNVGLYFLARTELMIDTSFLGLTISRK